MCNNNILLFLYVTVLDKYAAVQFIRRQMFRTSAQRRSGGLKIRGDFGLICKSFGEFSDNYSYEAAPLESDTKTKDWVQWVQYRTFYYFHFKVKFRS